MGTTVLLWMLALAPAALFALVVHGYGDALRQKRAELQRLLAARSFALYLRAYGASPDPGRGAERDAVIDRLLGPGHTFRAFGGPLLGVVVVVWGYAVAALARADLPVGLPPELAAAIQSVPAASFAALGGAAVHGLLNAMSRSRTLDLTPLSLHYVWLRVAAAPILGAAVASTFVGPLDLLAAFGVGLFPLTTVLAFVRARAATQLGITESGTPVELPDLRHLQGMTPSVARRLRESDVTSAQQLATADPVRLFLQTGFEWTTLGDLVDQALLFVYVGADLEKLRPMGIRGAVAMLAAAHEANGDGVVADIAERIGRPQPDVRRLAASIARDPRVAFVRAMGGASGESPSP